MLIVIALLSLIVSPWAATVQLASRSEWGALAGQSTEVVIGTVSKDKYWVTQPSKKSNRATNLPGGQKQIELTNPSDFVVGRVAHLRVEETLKTNAKTKRGDQIKIFLPGWMSSDQAVLEPGVRYVIFLSPLKADQGQLQGTMLYRPEAPSKGMVRFNPRSVFAIASGANGATRITERNQNIIREIKAALPRSQ